MNQPFQAAGASTALPLFNAHVKGLSLPQTLWQLWSGLDLRHVGSLVAIAGVAPTAWAMIKQTGQEAYAWIKHFFIASVTIPGSDRINRSVASWLLAKVVEPQSIRFLTAKTEVGQDRSEPLTVLRKTRRPVQYCPHWENTWFFHRGHLFMVSRSAETFSAALRDPGYDGIGAEDLTISCLGRSAAPIKQFIDECRDFADQQTQYYSIVYARDRYGLSWKPKARRPIRRIETVHFDQTLKRELLLDIKRYLDPKTQNLYRCRNMPYRRGYLLYGPPGTGKSSLSAALGGEFGLDLYEVNVPRIASDADLEQMFQEIPPRCIVLLEDIDAVWTDREASSSESQGTAHSTCSLSGLLNVLDGVGSQEGRIVIMTTNWPDRLDSALVRPGRVDMKVYLGNISQRSAEEMFVRMFAPDPTTVSIQAEGEGGLEVATRAPLDPDALRLLASSFAIHVPDNTFTPSQLEGFFQMHLDNPDQAVASIEDWVRKETIRRQTDIEFHFIDKN